MLFSDFLYDNDAMRKKVRVLRQEDLHENAIGFTTLAYKFGRVPWSGVLSSSLDKWTAKFTHKANISTWRSKLEYELLKEIEKECAEPMEHIGYIKAGNPFVISDLNIDLIGENFIDQALQNL